ALVGHGVADGSADLAGAPVQMVDDRGARLFLTTPASGDFSMPLFANRTYAGSVSAAGYTSRAIPASQPTGLRTIVPIVLSTIPVRVQGTVLLNGSVFVTRPVTIRAVPIGNGAIAQTVPSDSNGGYSFALVPGTYDLSVDENVSTSRDLRYQ